METTHKTVGDATTPSIKFLAISDLKITEKDGKVFIEGYANTKDRKDRYGDVPTVFPKLRAFVYELSQYQKNPVMLINHRNAIENIAGSMVEIAEDEKGLKFKGVFSNSELDLVKHTRQVYKEGHAKAISIGGIWHYEDPDNPSHLTLAEIYEISLVAVGADPNALASAMEKAINLITKEADPQTQASGLHEAKAEIDRWLEELRNEKLMKEIEGFKKKFA